MSTTTPMKIQIIVQDDGSVKVQKFAQEAEKAGRKGESSFRKTGKSLDDMNRKTVSATTQLIKMAAQIGAVWGGYKIAQGFLDTAKAFEQMEIKLNALTRGRGPETLERINAWALAMPVNTRTAVDTFTMMMAMGLDPTIEKMTTLVDVSVLFGDEAMPRIARALGQMKNLGKVSAEELNQLTEVGINARKYLKETFNMTVEELQKSGVDIDLVIKSIMDGLEAEFGGASKMAMETWSGMTTTLISYWDEFKREMMDSGPFDTMKAYFGDLLRVIEDLRVNGQLDEWAKDMARAVLESVHVMLESFIKLKEFVLNFRGLFGSFVAAHEGMRLNAINAKIKEFKDELADGKPWYLLTKSDEEWRASLVQTISELERMRDEIKINATAGEQMALDNIKALEKWKQKADELRERLEMLGQTHADDPWGGFSGLEAALRGPLKDSPPAIKKLTAAQKKNAEMVEKLNFDYKVFTAYLDQLGIKDWEFEVKIDFVKPEDDLFGGYGDSDMANAIRRMGDDAAYSKELIDELSDSLSDMGSLFDGSIFGDDAGQSINNLMESLGDMYDMYGKIAEREKEIVEQRKKANLIDDSAERAKAMKKVSELETKYTMDSINAQMEGFTQLFGAIKNMYAENSAEHQRWAQIEKAAAIATILLKAAQAIINAGASGDGYTAIARMAAMAAAVGAVLSQVGLSVSGPGGGGMPEPADYTAGSTLYGVEEGTVSESLSNGFEMLEDLNLDQYGALLDIYLEMRRLNANITGLATSIVRTGVIGSLDLPNAQESGIGNALGSFTSTMTKLVGSSVGPLGLLTGGFLDKLLGGLIDSIASYLFGGDVSYEMLESGLMQFVPHAKAKGLTWPTMGQLMAGERDVEVRPYLWYEQKISGGIIGDDDSQKKWLYGDKADDPSRLITNIIKSIGETMLDLAEIFGFGEEAIKDYSVELGKIDLKNLSADEVQEALSAWFSNFADEMAGDVFGELLTRYQKADEGLFETAIRLAVEKEMIMEVLDMTGQGFAGTSLEAVHFSQALIEVAGSLESLSEAAQTYFEEYFTEAEKQVWLSNNLADAYNAIGVEMPLSRNEFKNLMASIDLTTDSGQALYVALLEIAGATDAYYDALEAANKKIIDAQRELTGTVDQGTLADIEARYGWGNLGQGSAFELIQKFIDATPTEIEAYAAAMGVTTEQLVDDIMTLADIFDWLGDEVDDVGDAVQNARTDFAALRNQIENMLTGVSGSFGGAGSADALMSQIVGMQSIPMSEMTGDNLLAMSEKLIQWYNAKTGEAQAVANEEAEAARLLVQVSDRLGSLVSQIDSTIRAIKYSGLNVALPAEKAAESLQDYNALLTAAQAGGRAEVQEYLSFVQTHLQTYQDVHKSNLEYQDESARVMADMEAIKAKAGVGGYDAAILAELESGHETVHADLSEIQATFSEFEGWILKALGTLERMEMIIHIDWAGFTGDMDDALGMITELINVYGPDHEYILKFVADMPMTLFSDLDDLATAAGWIAAETGGFNSTAEITFLKNVAQNWEWENLDEIMHAIGWVKAQAGSWTADATISFVATLMDRYDVPIDQIDFWLYEMGITDADVSRTVKINLIYEMVSSGSTDLATVAEYAYNQAYAAWISNAGSAAAISILEELQGLGSMWGINDASVLGGQINLHGGYNSDPYAWYQLWDKHSMPRGWSDGGLSTGPMTGHWELLHGDEWIIPMNNGPDIPVKPINGGSNRGEEITLLRELVELQKEEIDTLRAKDTSPNITLKLDTGEIIKLSGEYVSERSKRGTLEVRSS